MAVRGDTPESFAHDPAGTLLAQSSAVADDRTNVKGNRLLMQGDRHFDYDAFGNLMRERRGAGQRLITDYRYDSQHRLIGASLPNGSQVSYRYDAFGRRTAKIVDGKTTEFLWQGDRLIAESGPEQYRSYVYEPGSFRPLAMLQGKGKEAEPFYYQLDHLGTPQELTSAAGEILWSVKYRAYGNVAKLEIAEVDNPLRFQGQYFDAETGLHYNRHRYYNPNTGSYLTPDPIKLAGGLNNYQYVNNPTGWVDPLGLTEVKGDCPGNSGGFLDKPADSDGSINIGAGHNPKQGYYNIDIDPKTPGVHQGDATSLPQVKTGSQSKINMDNPYGYDPLNPEIMRVLSHDGQITMTGNTRSNKYVKGALRRLEELKLEIVSRQNISSDGYKLVDGSDMAAKNLEEVVIRRKN